MAKKKEINPEILSLKKDLAEEETLIGAKVVLKSLKKGIINKIYLTSNCPEAVREEVENCCKELNTTLVNLNLDNEQLGVVCKKSFFISVLGVKNKWVK